MIDIETIKHLAHLLGARSVDMKELQMGTEEELKEHKKTVTKYCDTDPTLFAASIALDHLEEDPQYYSKAAQKDLIAYRIRQNQKEG